MNLPADEAEKRLKESKDYVQKFKLAFNTTSGSKEQTLTLENVQNAIGAYLRTLLTRSDYDRFLDGNNSAMSKKAKKGLANFINFGCKGCHTGVSVGGQSIQKFPLRDYNSFLNITNTFNEEERGREVGQVGFNFNIYHPYPFENSGEFMGNKGEQMFRVPILRNVTKTSPYFHNGSIDKIREAVYIMGKYQLGMTLPDNQIDEIVAFLESLEGDIVDYKILEKDEL
jgi:cytochrome c peroxidase